MDKTKRLPKGTTVRITHSLVKILADNNNHHLPINSYQNVAGTSNHSTNVRISDAGYYGGGRVAVRLTDLQLLLLP